MSEKTLTEAWKPGTVSISLQLDAPTNRKASEKLAAFSGFVEEILTMKQLDDFTGLAISVKSS